MRTVRRLLNRLEHDIRVLAATARVPAAQIGARHATLERTARNIHAHELYRDQIVTWRRGHIRDPVSLGHL